MTTIDLASRLAAIPDRRRAEGKIHGQVGVILFSIIAMPSGARSCRQIHTLIRARLSLLNGAFPSAAPPRAPAYTSARGILRRIDPNELEQAFRRHAESLDSPRAAAPSRFIAIDGKTLRQSFDAFADRKAAHALNAFAVDHRMILAHEVIDEKSNEILVSIRRGPQGYWSHQVSALFVWTLILVDLDQLDEVFDAEVGERHDAVVAEAVDPDHAVFGVHFIGDIVTASPRFRRVPRRRDLIVVT